MHQETIKLVVDELGTALRDRFVGRVFQLSPLSLAIDFGARPAGHLFISVDPAQPRFHLIKRRQRELEQQSIPPLLFAQALRSHIGGGKLISISKDSGERIVRFEVDVENEIGELGRMILVAQLTGRSANLFLLNNENKISHALRAPKGEGQEIGQSYQPPPPQLSSVGEAETIFNPGGEAFPSLSAELDKYYLNLDQEQSFAARAKAVRERIKKELAQRTKLKNNLERDLVEHGNPEQHKRLGDLLLANISTAKRSGASITLKDYYSEGEPEIVIDVDENTSLQDEAGRCFARYTKAKRAAEEIRARLDGIEPEISKLKQRHTEVEKMIATGDEVALSELEPPVNQRDGLAKKKKEANKLPGVRRYRSSDGYEVLVGRAARTNDKLTFKVASPHDLWLHAADYPGSHVIIRNPSRTEIPHRSIIEAAQLAAKFSQAGEDSKVTVHYTPRKFLSKPKGAAPGLVRMSSFKSINVKPGEVIVRI